MKKILLLITSICSIGVYAQKSNVESAAIYLRNLEMEDAKKAIDAAAVHEETKTDPKMWFFYTAIYDTIYRNPAYAALDNNVVEKFAIACRKCVDTDVKKRYDYYCLNVAIINSAFASYNKGLEYYNAKDFANALKFFNYVLDVIPYDKEKVLVKNNITDKSIILTMADMAMKAKNNTEAKKHLSKLIEMDYNDHLIYALLANIYLEEKDTVTALKTIDSGRKKYPTEKDLINQELNIYIIQGKQDILITKLNETIALDPENFSLLYVRGNVYDNVSNGLYKKGKYDKDTADIISKKAKAEKAPVTKAKLDNAVKRYNASGDSVLKVSKDYVNKAETDYKKVIELNPDYLDAYYNLGALTNNKTTAVVEKMNSINAPTQAEYDKKFAVLKKVQDSILNVALGHFKKALELAEILPDDNEDKKKYKNETTRSILYSMQQVYANLGDEKNTIEMMKRRKELN